MKEDQEMEMIKDVAEDLVGKQSKEKDINRKKVSQKEEQSHDLTAHPNMNGQSRQDNKYRQKLQIKHHCSQSGLSFDLEIIRMGNKCTTKLGRDFLSFIGIILVELVMERYFTS